jgi:hypothetical protein
MPGGDATVGIISSAGLYTAPDIAPANSSVSITARSVADPNQSATAIVGITAAPLGSGTAYYVDTGGNDTNDGITPTTPWRTLAKVNSSLLSPGDLILLKRGEVWQEELIVPSSGATGTPISFDAYGIGDPPVIDAQNIRKRAVDIIAKDWISIRNLTLQNSTSITVAIRDGSHVTIENCTIKNSAGTAIVVSGVSPNLVVDHNVDLLESGHASTGFVSIVSTQADGPIISNNAIPDLQHAMTAIGFVDVNDVDVHGNVIDGNGIAIGLNACSRNMTGGQVYENFITNVTNVEGDGESIELTGHEGPLNWQCQQGRGAPILTVSANLYRNVIVGGPSTMGGIDGWHAIGSVIYQNIVFNIAGSAMQWTAMSANNLFYNNTIYNANKNAIDIYSGSSASIQNNIIDKADVGISSDASATVSENYNIINSTRVVRSDQIAPGDHTLVADPQFITSSPSVADGFKLLSTSPAIDSGENLGPPYNWALDPGGTIIPFPLVDQNSLGNAWERGAFAFR